MISFKKFVKLREETTIGLHHVLYHVSPFPKFDGTRSTSVDVMNDHYNQLSDELDNHDGSWDDYHEKKRALGKLDTGIEKFKAGGRVHDDVSHANKDSFYASTQPEYWRDTIKDEHNTDFSHGGIYKVELHEPQTQERVPSGMGQMAPQAIVHLNNVKKITGPFKTMNDINNSNKSK